MTAALTIGIQEALVALLLHDPVGAKVVRGLIPAGSYDPHYRAIFQAGADYLDRYGKPAGEHALDLVQALKEQRPNDSAIYERIFHSIEATKGGLHRDYVIAQAGRFARHQRLRLGLQQAIEALEREGDPDSLETAEGALRKSLEASYDAFNPGLTYNDPSQALAFLDDPRDDLALQTAIPELDQFALGPAPGELHVFAADTGFGKSWWLIHLAKQAILQRRRVLYVTLELSAAQVSQRLTQAFFSITKRKEKVTRRSFERSEDGALLGLVEDFILDRPSFRDSGVRKHLEAKLAGFRRRPRLIIRQFPSGSLTIQGLRSYLASLEGAEGFLPDVILLDYPDEMDHRAEFKRHDLAKLYTDLRGIAVERGCIMAIVSQINVAGATRKTATKHNLAESKAKAEKADILITASQTQAEFELGLARLFVAKGRGDRDKFTVLISQAYEIGQFVVDSVRMTASSRAGYRNIIGAPMEEQDHE